MCVDQCFRREHLSCVFVCCLRRLDSVHVFPLIKRGAFVGVCAYLCLLIKQAYVSQTVRVQAFSVELEALCFLFFVARNYLAD